MAGSAPGAFNVGILYDSGLGVAKSPELAAAWYAQAAASRFGRAEYNLAMLYDAGIGVPRSHARAIALYKDAAEDGIVAARSHLPAAGQGARGTRPKPTPPKPMSQDKALQDFQEAQKLILSRGSAELSRAASLFRKAAEQHNALAEYDLGYSYDRGLGVTKDPGQAAAWYRRAAADTTDATLRQLAHTGAAALDGKPGK